MELPQGPGPPVAGEEVRPYAKLMSSQAALTLRALKRFRCIGDKCEDTCCSGWRVLLQHEDVDKLVQIRKQDPENSRGIPYDKRIVWPSKDKDGKEKPGHIKLRDKENCSFLTDSGWCELQAAHGEEALPTVCAMYPRQIRQNTAQIELGGLISCPQYARELLLTEDGAVIEPFVSHDTPREIAFEVSLDAQTLYEANLHPVRSLMLGILNHDEGTVDQRLFVLAFFAHKTLPFFRKQDRGLKVTESKAALEQTLDQFSDLSFVHALMEGYNEQKLPEQLIFPVIRGIFNAALSFGTTKSFQRVVETIRESYLGRDDQLTEDQAQDIWPEYCKRKARVQGYAEARLEQAIANRAINFVFSTWYLRDENLMQYVQRLLVELATSRFLFFSHPELQEIDSPDLSDESRNDIIDRVLVRVFSSTARSLGHDSRFKDALDHLLAEVEMRSLAGCTFLLRL